MKFNKIKSFVLLVLCLVVSLSIACSSNTVDNAGSSNGGSSSEDPSLTSGTRIQMTFNGQTIYGTLNNNSASRDLISRLPLTLNFSDYNSTEKIAYLPSGSDPLDTSDAPNSCTPQKGDITLYAPWGNLAVFYKPFRESNGLIPLGKLDDGEIDKLATMNGEFEVTIELEKKDETVNEKTLVVYFSYSGNTEKVAKSIAEQSGAALIEIVPQVPYTSEDVNYNNSSSRSQTERKNNERPEISNDTYSKINMDDYSVVIIGHPIWNSYEPMIIRSFIDHYNKLPGKTVYTFSTSASSPGSTAFNSIKGQLASSSNAKENLHFTSSTLSSADSTIKNALSKWGLLK